MHIVKIAVRFIVFAFVCVGGVITLIGPDAGFAKRSAPAIKALKTPNTREQSAPLLQEKQALEMQKSKDPNTKS